MAASSSPRAHAPAPTAAGSLAARVQTFAERHRLAYRLLIGIACGLLYYGVLSFFLGIPALNEQTQVRPASALGPVLGLFFGWPAIVGCAVGNLVADMATESDPVRLSLYFLIQLVYYSVPYLGWYLVFRRGEHPYPRLDTAGKTALYLALMLAASVLVTLLLLPVAVDNVSEAHIDEIRIYNNVLFLIYLGIPLLVALERSPLVPLAPPFVRAPYTHRAHMNLTQRVVTGVVLAALAIIVVFIVAVYGTYLASPDPYLSNPNAVFVAGQEAPDLIAGIYTYAFYFTACVFVPALVLARVIETHFARPIETLTSASRTFVAQLAAHQSSGTSTCGADELARVADVPTHGPALRPRNEILELIESTNTMRRDLVGYVDELGRVMAERERTSAELEIASDIQASTVPHDFTSFIERYHLDIAATLQPAREVGGDFYDVFDAGEHRVGFIIADVSGKGVPAALFMMRAITEIREQMIFRGDVGEALTLANQTLCEHNDALMFVTAFACTLDTQTGRVRYANAGHNPPWLRHGQQRGWLEGAGSPERASASGSGGGPRPGLVLGVLDGVIYREASIDLAPGDGLFLYTDGVTEAMDAESRLFGQGALEDALREADALDAAGAIAHVSSSVARFVGGAAQADDITMLAFSWNLPVRSISLPPDDRALDDLFGFIDSVCAEAGCGKRVVFDLKLVLEELFVNVAHYGFPEGQPRQSVHVEAAADRNAGVLHITISDAGVPYDPLAYESRKVDAELGADNKVGGLGILLVRKRTDGLSYERIGGRNVLHLIKRIAE
ncbi:MAG: SpoIIE family protein phosphatase [Coriobacteriia bacterium]|nr:SpoIIE family protein phosphatase [Coriobacteriia bacterium]